MLRVVSFARGNAPPSKIPVHRRSHVPQRNTSTEIANILSIPPVFVPTYDRVVPHLRPRGIPVRVFDFLNIPQRRLEAQSTPTMDLDSDVFAAPIRGDIIQRVSRWQLAKRRQGSACAKTKAEVRGGGAKPWSQKGQGRARAGSIRAPQFRGGGVVFPPKPRDWSYGLPKQVRAMGLRSVLSAKLAQGKLFIVNDVALPTRKTSQLQDVLDKHGWKSALIIDTEISENLRLAASNIYKLDVIAERGTNVYSILRSDTLVLTKDAVKALTARLKPAKIETFAERHARLEAQSQLVNVD
eukprot:TRINITY_DN12866_c0_g1_i1.p1 TRINITY_DN12866_c0_g1~~TRINITY_DN12866_c0_g1_i1.p1  ORF type:complete len:297 (-),score=92.09 TRINITY_DN12866_c0_g1_i1:56-946(-)